jgi:hypothetical protein
MSFNMNDLHVHQITHPNVIVRNAWQVAVGRLIFGLAFVIIGMVLFFSIFHQPLTLGVVEEALLGVLLKTLGMLLLQRLPRWLGIIFFFWEGLYACIAEGMMVSPISLPRTLGGLWLCVFAIGIAFISLKSRRYRKWEENMRILRNYMKSTTNRGKSVDYERGLAQLKQLLSDTAWEQEFLVYEARLRENLDQEHRYGTNEQIRSERSQIVDQLNRLAKRVNTTFNDLCLNRK